MIQVDEATCTGCGACVENCPQGAIDLVQGKAMINHYKCIECGTCLIVCNTEAIHKVSTSIPIPDLGSSLAHSGQFGQRALHSSRLPTAGCRPVYGSRQPPVPFPAIWVRRRDKAWKKSSQDCRRRFKGRRF